MRKAADPGIRAVILLRVVIPLTAVRTLPDLLRIAMIRLTAQRGACSVTRVDE